MFVDIGIGVCRVVRQYYKYVQVVVTLTLKKEAGHYCDSSMCIVYTTTQHQSPRDCSLNSHRSKDFRPLTVCFRLSRLRSTGDKGTTGTARSNTRNRNRPRGPFGGAEKCIHGFG
jgi:hypothetical protein